MPTADSPSPIDPLRIEARATDFVVRIAFLGVFAWWSLELVRPFPPVVIWAIPLAVALRPACAWLARRLGGRGAPAVLSDLVVAWTRLGPAGAASGAA